MGYNRFLFRAVNTPVDRNHHLLSLTAPAFITRQPLAEGDSFFPRTRILVIHDDYERAGESDLILPHCANVISR